ncbi:AAA domain-containing protein [Maridesulfovibrio sp.]|uniref:AAA domain-containing protein n=1 Tax=unclassified Maridesulfovibrio TaxID=2794999 RepID=UPI003B00C28E
MTEIAAKYTKYYQTTLEDELITASAVNGDFNFEISSDELRQGKLTAPNTEKLFRSKKGDSSTVGLTIAPVHLNRLVNRAGNYSNSPATIIPMLVPCTLTKEGALLPSNFRMPWIVRDYLDPVVSYHQHTLAHTDDVEEYFAQNRQDFKSLPWSELYKFFMRALDELAGISPDQKIEISGTTYTVVSTPRINRKEAQGGAASNIKRLYDNIVKEDKYPTLYASLFKSRESNRSLLTLKEESLIAEKYHLGQMSNSFGLGPSQRQTIHHFFATQQNETLAVNGPPGTGKTTLLQSAIASLWIKNILDSRDGNTFPPVIVATSSNNQAVTNVIRDFGTVLSKDSENILERRWLPDEVKSLGSYALSEGNQKKLGHGSNNPYLSMTMEWTGNCTELRGYFTEFDNPEFIKNSFQKFVTEYAQFSKTAQKQTSPEKTLKQIQQDLRNRIENISSEISTFIKLWRKCSNSTQSIEQTKAKLANISAQTPTSEQYLSDKAKDLQAASTQISLIKDQVQKAAQELESEPFWHGLLGFLSFVKNKKKTKATSFMLQNEISLSSQPQNLQDVCDALNGKLKKAQQVQSSTKQQLSIAEQAVMDLYHQRDDLQRQLNQINSDIDSLNSLFPNGKSLAFDRNGLYALLEQLDKTHRYEMFLLAVHYYEARWLEESIKSLEKNSKLSTEERFKRISMLTPCIVSTLFMTPKFFSSYGKPLYEFIDLLILDEAGQASPDKAAAVFALAQKALVVGDIYQIEPVYGITEAIDRGNLMSNQLLTDKNEEIPNHLAASCGNAMLMAQHSTPFQYIIDGNPVKERGMHLLEHRRCHKTIISYCKELAYPHMEMLTKHEPDNFYIFPQLGYAHIPSTGQKRNGSWHNPYEAQNIAQWIADNRNKILDHYQVDSIADVIAIVTPFTMQAKTLRASIQNLLSYEEVQKLTIGTVHKLQGAEKPIVLFSSVYGPDNVSTPFFDRSINMLNVAVSRAKHSFLVFGNMSMFRPGDNKPSQILGKHLNFTDGLSELPGFRLTERKTNAPVQHITDLDHHQEVLSSSFATAQNELLIVSPFLSMQAIKADNITDQIKEATQRGVAVNIYTDKILALAGAQHQPERLERVTEVLTEAGARLHFATGLHSKTLIVDNHTLIEGSFNWLSARRDKLARLEHSILYRDSSVAAIKNNTMKSLNAIMT